MVAVRRGWLWSCRWRETNKEIVSAPLRVSADGKRSFLPGRIGVGRKLGVVFALLTALVITIGVLVSVQLDEMRQSLRRVLEEEREAGIAREIALALRSIESHAVLDVGTAVPDASILETFLDDAEQALLKLEQGPSGNDPSEELHEGDERSLYAALHDGIGHLREALSGEARLQAIRPAVTEVLRLADALALEMREEASRSGSESKALSRDLRKEVTWMIGGALGVLSILVWLVQREIVRPIRALRESAGRIGRGDLDHRVAVSSGDEIGQLAREFNDMAEELHSMRADLERRVEERTQEFLRAARLAGLGTMAAGIAHEINNPLASIASCAEGLERRLANGGASPERQREYLQIIAKEAWRAREITSRLLEFARADPGARITFSLADLLGELRVLLDHRLRSRGLELDVRCDPEALVTGNPSECKQVLLNLIDNAIDASPRGARIRVECRRSKDEIVLEVEDQGPGIAPENLERIYDPFFTTKEPGKGTGLGLAIVHAIVESHGGRIEASNSGRGALFRVHVPQPSIEDLP